MENTLLNGTNEEIRNVVIESFKEDIELTNYAALHPVKQKYMELKKKYDIKGCYSGNDLKKVFEEEKYKNYVRLYLEAIKDFSKYIKSDVNTYILFINHPKYSSYKYFDIFKIGSESGIGFLKEADIVYTRLWEDEEKYRKEKKLEETKDARLERERTREQKLQELIKNSEIVVKDYITSDCKSGVEYCKINRINPSTFSKYIAVVKELYPELHEIYCIRKDENNRARYAAMLGNVRSILKKINYGIKENDKIREYTLDDFENDTNHSLEVFEYFVYELYGLKDYEVRKVQEFVRKNKIKRGLRNKQLLYSVQNRAFK